MLRRSAFLLRTHSSPAELEPHRERSERRRPQRQDARNCAAPTIRADLRGIVDTSVLCAPHAGANQRRGGFACARDGDLPRDPRPAGQALSENASWQAHCSSKLWKPLLAASKHGKLCV